MKKKVVIILAVTLFAASGGCASEKAGTVSGESVTESVSDLKGASSGEKGSGKKASGSDESAAKASASDASKADASKASASDASKADASKASASDASKADASKAPASDASKADVSKTDASMEDDSSSVLFDEIDTESDDALEPDEFVNEADGGQIQEAEKAGTVMNEAERQELLEQVREGSLDVENDIFAFEEMTSFIGKPESELISLIGADGHPDGFATKLFGEDVAISCTVDGEKVTGIRLLFAQTDGKLLANAISEELGTDPDEAEGGLVWTYQGKVVRQQDADGGILVTVAQEQ